jgi:exodeoxyribonuclease-3
MKLATWNINSLTIRLPQVLDWLASNPVDVLALQELKLTDDKFPVQALLDAGYHSAFFGQKTYNGVALLSREPVTEVVRNIPGFDDDMARVIVGTCQGLRVVGAYFPNGQEPGSDKFEYKLEWLAGLRRWLKAELVAHPKLVLMGDFNITTDDADVWDPVGLAGSIHCTDEERYELQALKAIGLVDAHRLFPQAARSFSWWDYRNFAFRRNHGLRIDYVLVSEALKAGTKACYIDVKPRKNERPSDHVPVVVDLTLD